VKVCHKHTSIRQLSDTRVQSPRIEERIVELLMIQPWPIRDDRMVAPFIFVGGRILAAV
jgi:hypothetical protein